MRGQSATADQSIAAMASRQHGLVTRRQLLAAGIRPTSIDRRLTRGLLHRIHPGIYGVGHRAPHIETAYLAAVLACGEGALLARRAAASHLRLIKVSAPPEVITRLKRRRIPGITTWRCREIHRLDATTHRGIPVTTVPRTLVDLAAVLAPTELAHAFHQAQVIHGTGVERVEATLARRPNSQGAGTLRRVLRGDERILLSWLERRFVALLVEGGLPLPVTNILVDARYVDCRWTDRRLTVELDSYRYHATRHAWELDHRREREAYARGDAFRRYSYGDVVEEPAGMLTELVALLRAA